MTMTAPRLETEPFAPAGAEAEALECISDLVARARAAGADAADAVMFRGASLSATQRLGEREDLERSESDDIGLRVMIGKRQAIVASTDASPRAFDQLVERAISMARHALEDPDCGLAHDASLAPELPNLDLFDPGEPSANALFETAAVAEDAARAVPGVTNSEGASASWGRGTAALVTSAGFAGSYTTSRFGVSASVLAGVGTAMQTDYDFSSARHQADLEGAAVVGRNAGERTVRRLDARKVATAQVPVVYEWRVAGGLLHHLAAAIGGGAIARGTSFLKDRRGKPVFAPGTTIVDDPRRARGLASRPCDGEGVRTHTLAVVEDGVLQSWLLDTRTANQLGLRSTGHASRGTGAPPSPSPSNLYLQPGPMDPEALIADIKSGLFVTGLIGFGINPVTGDYSRGVSGFWIENGEITHPVHEMTIAGNLMDMFRALTPANDLAFRYGVDAPTVRIDGMTVAGA
jgi:PmbA protein